MVAAGGGEAGGAAEGDVEEGGPGVDAEGVVEEFTDVAGADAGRGLDDVGAAGGGDDDLGVGGAVADADGADGLRRLSVDGLFHQGRELGWQVRASSTRCAPRVVVLVVMAR
ncbi:hypothetical protein [Streptomyces virginiae]|uniref:hypothetical protein n=1 Tax=Streptomyces virginiae TaxID=1961 RepID=UPI003700981D